VCGVQERRALAPLSRLRPGVALGLAVVVVVADRITTTLAEHHLHSVVHLWGPFGLALSFNSGFAFSLFSGRAVLVTVLLSIGTLVLAVVVMQARTMSQVIGGGLLLGGAAGNVSERIANGHHGQVADFITLTHWPTFNLADACITIGAIVVAASLLFGRPTPQAGATT
jgi:signal peptidase II